MRSIKVRTKLLIIFSGFISAITFLIVYSLFTFSRYQGQIEDIYGNQYNMLIKMSESRDASYKTMQAAANYIYFIRENNAVKSTENEMQIKIQSLTAKTRIEEIADLFQEFNANNAATIQTFIDHWAEWNAKLNIYFNNISDGKFKTAEEEIYSGEINEKFNQMILTINLISNSTLMYFQSETTRLISDIDQTSTILIITAIIIILLAVSQLFFFFVQVFRPVTRLTDRVRQISRGEGDLTQKIHVKNMDEFGLLASNFNDFISSLHDKIKTLKTVANENSNVKDDLAAGSEQTSSSVSEISANLNNISNTITLLDESISQTVKSINKVNTVISDLDAKIESQASMVEESSAAITEMIISVNNVASIAGKQKESADQLVEKSQKGNQTLESACKAVESIRESVDSIKKMTEIISSIASQTNLLAMNAAIEAAHAGEAGKGFAVVADEIRALAESTRKQSKDINSVLKDVILRIENAFQASTESKQSFSDVYSQIRIVTNAFAEITFSMAELQEGGSQILEAMTSLQNYSQATRNEADEMEKETETINNEINRINQGSTELVSAISEINSGIGEIGRTAELVNQITAKMSESTETMARQISAFKTI